MARAQCERVRRIGVLMGLAEDDPEMKARLGLGAQPRCLGLGGQDRASNPHTGLNFSVL
jgi:hypothetical protein